MGVWVLGFGGLVFGGLLFFGFKVFTHRRACFGVLWFFTFSWIRIPCMHFFFKREACKLVHAALLHMGAAVLCYGLLRDLLLFSKQHNYCINIYINI